MNGSTDDLRPEADAVPLRTCLAIGALAIAVTVAAVTWSWRMAAARVVRGATPVIPAEVAGVLQTLIGQDGRARHLADRQRALLDGYGWVDRGRGTVRVPVEVAMTLYLEDRKQR